MVAQGILEKQAGACSCFFSSYVISAEDDPVKIDILVVLDQFKDGCSASYFYVVSMGTKTQHVKRRVLFRIEMQTKHDCALDQRPSRVPTEPLRLHLVRLDVAFL